MLFLKNPVNQFQKRTLRVLVGQTEATPIDYALDATLGTGATFVKPLSTDTVPLTRSADAFTLKNGLVPGMVMHRGNGNTVCVSTGVNAALVPEGLLGQFVGGDFDELGNENKVGIWRGVNSRLEILAPAFDDTGLATAYAAATAGTPAKLYAGTDGRLVFNGAPANRVVVAHLVERISSQRIVIDLKV